MKQTHLHHTDIDSQAPSVTLAPGPAVAGVRRVSRVVAGRAGPDALLVLRALAVRADDAGRGGVADGGAAEGAIAGVAGLSRKAVRRKLAWLEGQGYAERCGRSPVLWRLAPEGLS